MSRSDPIYITLEYKSKPSDNDLIQTISITVGYKGTNKDFIIRKRNISDYEKERSLGSLLPSPRDGFYQRHLATIYGEIDAITVKIIESINLAQKEGNTISTTNVLYYLFFSDLLKEESLLNKINAYISYPTENYEGIRNNIINAIQEENINAAKVFILTMLLGGTAIYLCCK